MEVITWKINKWENTNKRTIITIGPSTANLKFNFTVITYIQVTICYMLNIKSHNWRKKTSFFLSIQAYPFMRKKVKKIIFITTQKLIIPYSTITPIFQTPYNRNSKFKEINSFTYNKNKNKKKKLTNKINSKILKENSNTLVIQCSNFNKKPKSQQLEPIYRKKLHGEHQAQNHSNLQASKAKHPRPINQKKLQRSHTNQPKNQT